MLMLAQDVSVICSVLNLTCMSMERFYAIVYPLKSRSVCTVSQVTYSGSSFELLRPQP